MKLVPSGAFGRTLALLLALAAFIIVGTLLLVGIYRAQSWALMVSELAQTRLELITPLIATFGPQEGRRFATREYASQGLVLAEQPLGARAPTVERLVAHRLEVALGAGAVVRVYRDNGLELWLRTPKTQGLWLGMPLPPRGGRILAPLSLWLGIIALIAVIAALWFASQLCAPLRRLAAIAPRLVHGEPPADFRPSGPRELHALGAALMLAAHQARDLREERELWLAGVSHDLRTPLTRMRFSVEMLPEHLDLRAGIIEDIGTMDAMLGQFLDYLRLGREETPQSCDVAKLLREALARIPGTEAVSLNGTLEAEVRQQAFVRAVSNLVVNALRHGVPPVRVRVGREDGRAYVAVQDAGAGFAADRLSELCIPFKQGEAARNCIGTGLGLAIVAKVAELHDGALEVVREQPGFCLRLSWPWQ